MVSCRSSGVSQLSTLGVKRTTNERQFYDTRRDRSLLEGPKQSERWSLFLQGRPTSHCAETLEVGGLDNQFCASECDSGAVGYDCPACPSGYDGKSKRRGNHCQCYHRHCGHRSRLLAVRIFIINQTMESLTPNNGAAGNSHRPFSFDRDMKFEHHICSQRQSPVAVPELGR